MKNEYELCPVCQRRWDEGGHINCAGEGMSNMKKIASLETITLNDGTVAYYVVIVIKQGGKRRVILQTESGESALTIIDAINQHAKE